MMIMFINFFGMVIDAVCGRLTYLTYNVGCERVYECVAREMARYL